MVVPEAFLVRDCCVRMAPVGGSGAASLSAAEAGFMMALSSLHPSDNNNNAGKREKRGYEVARAREGKGWPG